MAELKYKTCKHCGEDYPQFSSLRKCPKSDCQKKDVKPKKISLHSEQRTKAPFSNSKSELTNLEQLAKVAFQTYSKLKFGQNECISCGTKTADAWHGGHLFKCELFSGLIFVEDNCWLQCRKCNIDLDGNHENYKTRLEIKIGTDRFNNLLSIKDQSRFWKPSRFELIEIANKYKLKIKEINSTR